MIFCLFHSILLQCTNWDGGGQERDTVLECIKSVYPNAAITSHKKNKYPLRVKIEAKITKNDSDENGAKKIKVWDGDQKHLFRKNAQMRTKTMQDIQTKLEMLREELEM